MTTDSGRPPSAESGILFLVDALATLRSLVTAIGGGSDDQVMSRVVDALMEHPEVDGCALYLRRPLVAASDAIAPDLRIARGMDLPTIELAERLSMGVMRNGSPHHEPDLSRHAQDLRGSLVLLKVGPPSWAIGTLAAWSREPAIFRQWHRNLLELFCDILGLYFSRQVHSLVTPAPAGGSGDTGEASAVDQMGGAVRGSEKIHPPGAPLLLSLDPLTGFLDRFSFESRLDAMLRLEGIRRESLYLFYIDIDRYRLIRRFGGEQTAERVIRILGELVRHQAGQAIAVGRLGSDELGILADMGSLEDAILLAQDLIANVDALRMSYAGQPVDISISIGLAPFNMHWLSRTAALGQAREACNAAQRHGGGNYQVYSEALDTLVRSQDDALLYQLTCALKEDRLILYAQPIVPAHQTDQDGPVAATFHEILVRMQDKRGNILPANAFLPLAEHYGLSVKLDSWVIRETFRFLSSTAGRVTGQGLFAVNLSGHSIDNPRLLEYIVAQFAATGLDAGRVCFEITETAAISDIEAARHFIHVLKRLGCRFALDDFGSGHASFLYLRDLEVDYLKIDGNLVREITRDPVSLAFVRSIHDIGKIMDKLTIAEYVESSDVLAAVSEIGIDFAQGYAVGRPKPLAQQ